MTMATATMSTGATGAGERGGHSLEELVDRMMDALFPRDAETAETTWTVPRSVHEARRLRQAGDLDGALALLADADTTQASEREIRWVYAEWLDLARRRFRDGGALVYSPAIGRAAVLAPRLDGALEVAAVLGMRWRPGRVVSRRSLRGLRLLAKDGA